MKSLLAASVLGMMLTCTAPVQAQFSLFKRPRPAPSQRVPELILTLKTDGDERRRIQAAEELREYDPKTYAEIVPVLVDVAQHDGRPNVRAEALSSLARLRPVTSAAGQALEKAASSDDNWRVRLQAKSALMKYHLAGFSSNQPAGTTAATPTGRVTGRVTTQEPPLAHPLPRTAEPPLFVPMAPSVPSVVTTPEPPLAFPLPPAFTPPQ